MHTFPKLAKDTQLYGERGKGTDGERGKGTATIV